MVEYAVIELHVLYEELCLSFCDVSLKHIKLDWE